ncbi:DUF1911 domain-containing protein, partial [Curtobacterium sp. MCBA15_001]|uniref:DUF1911 domain-containing protein n=1 Tax=Curtobacterium sp. MCBA15_001 TaxID=1898731 RepID=UPI001C3155E2
MIPGHRESAMSLSRRNGVLTPRAEQFNGRYWQGALDITFAKWDGRVAAAGLAADLDRRRRAVRGAWHMGLRYLAAQYSAGRPLEEVGTTVRSVATSYAEWVELESETGTPSPTLAKSNEYFISVLRLVGLATGTGQIDSARAVLAAASEHDADALIRALATLHGTPVAGEVGDPVPPPRFARPLLAAIEHPSGAASSITTYLADWPTRMRSTDWIGSLDRVAPGDSYGEGFFGYWAFELAALNVEGRSAALRSGSPLV